MKRGRVVNCERCGKEVYKSPCHIRKHKRHFCSTDCWNAQQTTEGSSLKMKTCPVCQTVFSSKRSVTDGKGYWYTHCSAKCSKIGRDSRADYRDCLQCGKQLRCVDSLKHRKKFCSHACKDAYKTATQRFVAECKACGKAITKVNSLLDRHHDTYCSRRCMDAFRVFDNAPNWKGGSFLHRNGYFMVNVGMSKKPYPGHPYGHPVYRARYRTVIEIEKKSYLPRTMPVLHLNGDSLDDRVDNLYICSSIRNAGQILQGAVKFPTSSNVQSESFASTINYDRLPNEIIRNFIIASQEAI